MAMDLRDGSESLLVDTKALDLDPAFSRDGRTLYWSSGEAGDMDVWSLDLHSLARARVTTDEGNELSPRPLAGRELLFVAKKRGKADVLAAQHLDTGVLRVLREEWIASNLRPAVSPEGGLVAATFPSGPLARLLLLDRVALPEVELRGSGLPLMPAFSHDGSGVFYVEADRAQRFRLMRVRREGGEAEDVSPLAWDFGERTARLTVRTRRSGRSEPLPARLSVVDASGNPAVPDQGVPRFDSQNGIAYFFSDGLATIEVPVGEVRVSAVRGLATPVVSKLARVGEGGSEWVLDLEPLWDAQAEGYFSGDHHWHLNYGGSYVLRPEDALAELRAEDLDVATPQLANLHTRFMDLEHWDFRRLGAGPPLVAFAQEVRSHFLGHLGLVGTATPYWPWYWGPGYSVYGEDDRENADALVHARREGGFGMYVHPVRPRDPFPRDGRPDGIPLELVPDAVLGDLDGLEVACLWSDELGTSEVWYRLLNLGLPIAPTGGPDAMPNLFRMMAVGTTRVYVKTEGPLTLATYLDGLRAGRSFVTNGPLVRFEAGGASPGGAVGGVAGASVPFRLTVSSSVAFERAEVLVNGRVVFTGEGLSAPGTKSWTGTVRAPAGGWIAARVWGGETAWPAMDSYPFAQSAPVWFFKRGSRDPAAASAAARDLLRWLDVADAQLVAGYKDAPIPKLRARFAEARRRLAAIAR